ESGAYYSADRGKSWKQIKSVTNGRIILFDGAPNKVIVGDEASKVLLITIGGSVQIFSFPNYPNMISMAHAADGSLRGVGYTSNDEGRFYSSYDDGANWVMHERLNGGDNNTFILDPSDPNRFVVVNEDFYFTTDANADLFLTTDNGDTWQDPYSNPRGPFGDLTGSGIAGCHDYFVGTETRGVLRSTDQGLTWNSIGGPQTAMDSRSLGAITDSLIFAIDQSGSIWSTTPQTIGTGSVFTTGYDFFQKLSILPCSNAVTSELYFISTSCIKIGITSLEVVGKDSLQYSIVGSVSKTPNYPDSIGIRFSPKQGGKTDARLKVTFSDGSSKLIDLGVTVSPVPITLSRGSLFGNDTITICSIDSNTLVLSAACPFDISAITIGGPDAGSFILKGKKTATLPKDSIVPVVCIPLHTGNLDATLHLIGSDGRVWDVPLSLFVEPTPLAIGPAHPFGNDSILVCSADSARIVLSAPCALDLRSITITGPDASSFVLEGQNTAALPADSVVMISCIPQHSGNLKATLHLISSDGRSWDIPLDLFVQFTPLLIGEQSPFTRDTIPYCSNDSGVFHFTAPCNLDLASLSFTGVDAASFQVEGKSTASLPADSIIKILCIPEHAGNLEALLHVVGADGRSWDMPVSIFASEPPLQYRPATLFANDSMKFCSTLADSIYLSSLCALDLASITFTGADASSFSINGKASASLPKDSMIFISCSPQRAGFLSAMIHFVSVGGLSWDVPLSPFVEASPTIEFDTRTIASAFTDTVGGDVVIPISFLHSGSSANAEFTVHFDSSALIYRSVSDRAGFDHTIGRPDGISARAAFNTTADTILFAKFSFYPVDSACTNITIDSLTGAAGSTACLDILSNSLEAEICSPAACGRTTLARFERFGMFPQLSIVPNPSSGVYTISSSKPLGEVRIFVTDRLGVLRSTQTGELSAEKNMKLDLEFLPSGVYFVRVSGSNRVIPVLLEK
ncbi:MAG: T9SS type A sorting domain-containing protein, partial [Bacteroidota bacterium]|nr:T9SS type A sorting domain-containing protein [Bacteroidota bacterium]